MASYQCCKVLSSQSHATESTVLESDLTTSINLETCLESATYE